MGGRKRSTNHKRKVSSMNELNQFGPKLGKKQAEEKEKKVMCKTNEISRPNTGRLQKMLRTALSAVVLALLCNLPAMRASAQTCIKCPTDAQSPAIADAFDIFTTRNGQ